MHVGSDVIARLINHPQPEMAVIYREAWDDVEGFVLRMDVCQSTLRHYISRSLAWSERDWLTVMGGIAMRLQYAHKAGYVHGDLKPSNGAWQSCRC